MVETRTVEQWVHGVPLPLKEAIRAEVETTGTSMNDLLVGSLARRFEIAFEASSRKPALPDATKPDIVLRMPEELRRRIKAAAALSGTSARDLIVAHFSDLFGTRFQKAPSRAARAAA